MSHGNVLRVAGHARNYARQLGPEIASDERLEGSRRLDAWNAITEGSLGKPYPSINTLAARLLAAMPQRYADIGDAREEVLSLMDACEAMK